MRDFSATFGIQSHGASVLLYSPIGVYSVIVLADIGKGVWSAAPANLVAAGAQVPGHCTAATL